MANLTTILQTYLCCLTLFLVFDEYLATRMSCAQLTMDEGSQDPIICDGFSENDTVTWTITPDGGDRISVECPPSETRTECNSSSEDIQFFREATSSEMRIIRNHREIFGNANVLCAVGSSGSGCASKVIRKPQPRPPVINGYTPGQIVRVGEALTLICTVSGGTPPVKSVTFFCESHADVSDTANVTSVSSQVIINPLTLADNGITCNCRASWEQDLALQLTASVTLIVKERDTTPTKPQTFPSEITGLHPDSTTQDGHKGGEDQRETTASPQNSDGDGPPVAAIGSGVAVSVIIIVVIIVVVLIIRRRQESRKQTHTHEANGFEENQNVMHESGDSPYEISDDDPQTSQLSAIQRRPVPTIFDPQYEDHNLNHDDEDEYASVSMSTSQFKVIQTHPGDHMDHNLYSAAHNPACNIPAPATAGHTQDEYAVVKKPKKSSTGSSAQPAVYAQVNKARPNTGREEHAQVNKPPKGAKSSPIEQNALHADDGTYTEVGNPKPNIKPKPALKPKPSSKPMEGAKVSSRNAADDNEYNVLRFQGGHPDIVASPDSEQQYSHISSI